MKLDETVKIFIKLTSARLLLRNLEREYIKACDMFDEVKNKPGFTKDHQNDYMDLLLDPKAAARIHRAAIVELETAVLSGHPPKAPKLDLPPGLLYLFLDKSIDLRVGDIWKGIDHLLSVYAKLRAI